MAETSKKDHTAFEKPSSKEDEAVVETVAPETAEEGAPVEEAPEATVKVKLADDYEGPTPVHVSTPGVALSEEIRLEVTKEGVEVPEKLVENFTSLPYVEVAE